MSSISARYAPMNRSHIPGFPNHMPCVDWQRYLPKFKDQEGDDVAFHLIKFHMHIHRLEVKFPEDYLMKMFMATLEEEARSWYEGLPSASLFSLEYFYSVFCVNYKESYPSLVLVENFCGNFDNLIQRMGIDINDEDLMYDEIEESLYELASHQEELVETSCIGTQDHSEQTLASSLLENETNLHHNVDIQVISHEINENSQPCQPYYSQKFGENHSNCFTSHSFSEDLYHEEIAENQAIEIICAESLGSRTINKDSYSKLQRNTEEEQVVLGLLDVAESIHDFTSIDLTYSGILKSQDDILIQEHERVFSVFSQTHEVVISYKYFPEHIKHVSVVDDVKNDHLVACPFEEGKPYERDCLWADFQKGIVLHVFKDPFASKLESSEKTEHLFFKNARINWGLQFELSFVAFFFLSGGVESKLQSRGHLLDWLHWNFEIT
jgi:hypothetical protein